MTYYGSKELAASFRTVRKNTIVIAEEIPEQHYGFRAAPETRTVAEMLVHGDGSVHPLHHEHLQGPVHARDRLAPVAVRCSRQLSPASSRTCCYARINCHRPPGRPTGEPNPNRRQTCHRANDSA